MKKMIAVLTLSVLFCGCTKVPQDTSTAQINDNLQLVKNNERSDNQMQMDDLHFNMISDIDYSTVESFLDSDYCRELQEKGFTVYLPTYDEERYDFMKIVSTNCSYKVRIKDTQTDTAIDICIGYDSFFEKPEDFAANAISTEGDFSTTAEKFGQTYDVYLMKTPYMPETEYTLGYLPFEGYDVYISSHRSTPEEVLEDFRAFDLVPADVWAGTQ